MCRKLLWEACVYSFGGVFFAIYSITKDYICTRSPWVNETVHYRIHVIHMNIPSEWLHFLLFARGDPTPCPSEITEKGKSETKSSILQAIHPSTEIHMYSEYMRGLDNKLHIYMYIQVSVYLLVRTHLPTEPSSWGFWLPPDETQPVLREAAHKAKRK